jgi:hypothetical protein
MAGDLAARRAAFAELFQQFVADDHAAGALEEGVIDPGPVRGQRGPATAKKKRPRLFNG